MHSSSRLHQWIRNRVSNLARKFKLLFLRFSLKANTGYLKSERFGTTVGDHETALSHRLAGKIGNVEAVAASDRIHFPQRDFDLLPLTIGAELRDIIIFRVLFRFNEVAKLFAVTFEAYDSVREVLHVDGIEVILNRSKSAIVFERDIATKHDVSGRVADECAFRASTHDHIVFHLPPAHGSGMGEIK